jgi:hypothetical protein
MIKYQKTNPVGIDKWIGRFQTQQQREIPALFGVDESLCLFYGRAEKVTERDVEKNVIYISDDKYEPIGMNNRYSFISYFILNGTPDFSDSIWNATLEMYCHGDLSKLYPDTDHRADEEFRHAICSILMKRIDPGEFISIGLIPQELQPFHSFKLNFIKHYQ